jgi:hypothetical protein
MSPQSHVDQDIRDRYEGRLTRKLSGFLALQRNRLRETVRAGERPPDEFWPEFEKGLEELLKQELGAVARQGAESVMSQLPSERKSRKIVVEIPEQDNTEWHDAVKALAEQNAKTAEAIAELARAMAALPAPVVNVENRVEPTPVTVEVPPIVLPEGMKAQAQPPRMLGRTEETQLLRDERGQPKGSRATVEYHYED